MAPKLSNRRKGHSSSIVRLYFPSAVEPSWMSSSSSDDSVLREVDNYATSVNLMVEGDDSDEVPLEGE